MAKYSYDVNTQTKYIDIQNNFTGGLKTVDTDDSLKGFFLRQADNVNITEFGFLEKRYGIEEISSFTTSKNIAFYAEFKGYEIIGYDDLTFTADGTSISIGYRADTRYSQNFKTWITDNSGTPGVTGNRFHSALSDQKLYVFNGFYPVVFEIDDSEDLVLYWMPYLRPDITTEVLSTYIGHNKLTPVPNEDYEDGDYAWIDETLDIYDNWDIVDSNFSGFLVTSEDMDSTYFKVNNHARKPEWSQEGENDYPLFYYKRYDPFTTSIKQVTKRAQFITNFEFIKGYYSGNPVVPTTFWSGYEDDITEWNYGGLYQSELSPWVGLYKAQRGERARIPNTARNSSEDTVFGNLRYGIFRLKDIYFRQNGTDYAEGSWVSSTDMSVTIEFNRPYIDSITYTSITETNPIDGHEYHAFDHSNDDYLSVWVKGLPASASGWDIKYEWELATYKWEFDEADSTYSYYNFVPDVVDNITQQVLVDYIVQDYAVFATKFRPWYEYDDIEGVYTTTQITEFPYMATNAIIDNGQFIVWGDPYSPDLLYGSTTMKGLFPDKYQQRFENQDQESIKAVTPYMGVLIVQTDTKTFALKGNSFNAAISESPYTALNVNLTLGCVAPESASVVRNKLIFLSNQGLVALNNLYAVDGVYNIKPIDTNIRGLINRQDAEAFGLQFDDQYWLATDDYIYRYDVDKGSFVRDVFTHFNTYNGIFKLINKGSYLKMVFNKMTLEEGGNEMIYIGKTNYTLPFDFGITPVTKIETSFLNQDYPFHDKNYKLAKFDFTFENQYNTSKDSIDIGDVDYTDNPVADTLTFTNPGFEKYHIYRFDLFGVGNSTPTFAMYDEDSVAFEILGYEYYDDGAYVDVRYDGRGNDTFYITSPYVYNDTTLDVYDNTYDNALTFYTWIYSETQTLNLDNMATEDQTELENMAKVEQGLGDRDGLWVFGENDFVEDTVTTVQNVKLSGRGKNIKVYMEDYTRSKWTMESIGFVYKMKRAKGR